MRITDKDVRDFAKEMGFSIFGIPGSRTIGKVVSAGGGYRHVDGPGTPRENMAYLRGYRDGLRQGATNALAEAAENSVGLDS